MNNGRRPVRLIDVDRELIVIRPEIEKANRGRAVVMTIRVKEELPAMKAAALRAKGATAETVEVARVFGIITNIKDGWKSLCETAIVIDLRFHDLRHTYARQKGRRSFGRL